MKTEDVIRHSRLLSTDSQPKEEFGRSPSVAVPKRARSATLLPEGIEREPCYLARVPMELLAEILLYMPSTRCVLALARCSKYFCATLVNNESSVFIWRNVRAACKPYAIPDPTPNFTEPAYAAFIFDGGECEMCEKKTPAMYMSFALRARLCGQSECRRRFVRECLSTISYSWLSETSMEWIPSAESDSCFSQNPQSTSYWPEADKKYREAQFTRLQVERNRETHAGRLQAFEERYKLEIERLPIIMRWSVDLYKWKQKRNACRLEVKAKNVAFAQRVATEEGWTIHDLVDSQTYGALHRSRINNLEEVQMLEYQSIRPKVDAEVIKIVEARKRSTEEGGYRRRRDDVEQHYNRLKSSGKDKVFPNLAQFRQLPIINVLQSKRSTTAGVAGDLQRSQLVAELLEGDLKKWRESASTTLAATLGFPNWKSASKKKLHPVDRLTARFRCKKCKREGHKYYEEGCLDFAGACAHVCLRPDLNKRAREKWIPDQFEKDDKAIEVVSKIIALCGANVEETESFQAVEALGPRIRCESCDSKVVMTFRNVIGHAQRHENMQISLLSAKDVMSLSKRSVEFGTCSKLLGLKQQAKKFREMRNYGCRHCFCTREVGRPVGTAVNAFQADPMNGGRLFNFNGLRSHIKVKHGIERICDEDVFWEKPVVWT